MANLLEIFTLGRVELRRGGLPVTGLASRKADALMIYLACTRQVHTREWLASLLWEDRSTSQSLANLRVVINSLRQQLAPFLQITSQNISLNLRSRFWIDAVALETALTSRAGNSRTAPRQELERVVALYQGNFLQGFYLRASPSFEEWMRVEQERLKRLAIQALDALVRACLAEQDYDAGMQYAARLLNLDPLREETQSDMMEMLARTAQHNGALAQYQSYRRLLADELEIEPGQDIRALYGQIHGGNHASQTHVQVLPDANGSARKPYTVPRQLSSFLGRMADRIEIAALLANPDCSLVTLLGPGGIGKTRLALQVAQDVLDQFQDGACLVELAPLREPALVATMVAQALRLPEVAGQDVALAVKNALRERNLLLILDNLEHLLDAAPVVTQWLAEAPGVKVLVTSREKLQLYGEHEIQVTPLSVPGRGAFATFDADAASTYTAIRLFVERVHAVQNNFRLTNENAWAIAEICMRLDGIPLAIELAAARCTSPITPTQLLAQLSNRLMLPDTGPRDRPARQRTFRATLDWSYNLLTEAEQSFFAALGVFVGTWTHTAAERVGNLHSAPAATLLDSLVAKNLLFQVACSDGISRYAMLEPIREYALEQLHARGENGHTITRHTRYYRVLAEQAECELQGPTEGRWLNLLELEHDNLRAALGRALAQPDAAFVNQTALRLGAALGLFWRLHSHLNEGRKWLEQILERQPAHAPAAHLALRAKVLQHIGWIAARQGDYATAFLYFQESLELWQVLSGTEGVADALHGLGHVSMLEQKYGDAMEFYQASLAQYRARGKAGEPGVVRMLYYSGSLAILRGEHAQADSLLQDSIALARELRSEEGLALGLKALAQSALTQDAPALAEGLYAASLKLCFKLGDWYNVSHNLMGLASAAALLQQPLKSARLFGADEALRESLGVPVSPAIRPYYERYIAAGRAQATITDFNSAWVEGRMMRSDEAVAWVLDTSDTDLSVIDLLIPQALIAN